jgi:hypothetical protein
LKKSKVVIWKQFPAPSTRQYEPNGLPALPSLTLGETAPESDEAMIERWLKLADISDAAGPVLGHGEYPTKKRA